MNPHRLFLTTSLFLLGSVPSALADPLPKPPPPDPTLRLVVNSNADAIQPDGNLTLREAIAIVNGSLPLAQLSEAEKAQVSPASRFAIEFNLPPDQTTI